MIYRSEKKYPKVLLKCGLGAKIHLSTFRKGGAKYPCKEFFTPFLI